MNMNIQSLMQQAQKMQKKMLEVEEAFKEERFTAEAGGGAVKATVGGDMTLRGVVIGDELMKSGDREMVQDLVMVAVNSAFDAARREKEARLSKLMGKAGAGMPGMF